MSRETQSMCVCVCVCACACVCVCVCVRVRVHVCMCASKKQPTQQFSSVWNMGQCFKTALLGIPPLCGSLTCCCCQAQLFSTPTPLSLPPSLLFSHSLSNRVVTNLHTHVHTYIHTHTPSLSPCPREWNYLREKTAALLSFLIQQKFHRKNVAILDIQVKLSY